MSRLTLKCGLMVATVTSAIATVLIITITTRRLGLTVALAQSSASPSAIPTPAMDPAVVGQWSPLYSWPEVGIHLAVLPDQRVVTFTDPEWNDGLQTPASAYIVTIPPGGVPGAVSYIPNGTDDIWCAGAAFFPDGRLMVVGGTNSNGISGPGISALNIFDWRTTAWTAGMTMEYARWYPTATTLADGEILVLSGSEDLNYTNADEPEVTTGQGTGPWRELSTAVLNLTLYPRAFLAPNGKVFVAGGGSPPGANHVTRYLDTTGTGSWTTVGSTLFGDRFNGTAAMYDDGKVLIAGGTPNFGVLPATNTAEVIDLNAPSPAWRYTNPMAYARQYGTATLLADGRILVVGGTSASDNVLDGGAALAAEMWDPGTEQWSTMASMNHARLYHSTAALMPDGRVISAGTTTTGVTGHDVDFFSPPYLFKGSRPIITSAPVAVNYGQSFTIQTPDAANISRINWIRLSAVTHSFNENQRINRLSFTAVPGSLNVTAPTNPNLCPPGHYMLFILNNNGVPSVAAVVQITAGAAPTRTPTSTPTATSSWSPTSTPTPSMSGTATPSATPTAATFVAVAGVSGTTTGAASVTTNGWVPQPGNMVAVFVELASTTASVAAVTDRLGNLYSFASGLTGTNGRVELWYSMGAKGRSPNSVTANLTASTKAAIRAEEFSGIPANATFLRVNANSSPIAGTNTTTGNVTTGTPSFLLADIGWDTGASASATKGGFARIGQVSNGDSSATICFLYAKASAPGTFGTGVTLSANSDWQGLVAAFGIGGSPTPTPTSTASPTATATAAPTPTATPGPLALRSSSTSAPTQATNAITINVPTGTQNGDMMIAFISLRSFGINVAAPAGWVFLRQDGFNADPFVSIVTYVRTASTEPASYTWTFGVTRNAVGSIASYSNCGGVDGSNGQGNSAGTFSSTAPGVTIPIANTHDVLLEVFSPAAGSGFTKVTLPPNATQRWYVGLSGVSQEVGEEPLSSGGATGNRVATLSINDRSSAAQILVLKPAQ